MTAPHELTSPSGAATTVLFWDIDGTLLSTGGAGRIAWARAAADVWGRDLAPQSVRTAGLTDVEIAVDIGRQLSGEARGNEVLRLIRRYEDLLLEQLRMRVGAVLSGAREILEDLAGRPDVTSVLLTGNTEAGAWVKLRHYGLDRYFAAGAFADETTDRIAIARKGWELATRLLGMPPLPDRSFVIGDTPHDIRCARAIGVRAVAVATGVYSAAQLGAHQPWWVVEQLPPPGEFAARLGLLGFPALDTREAAR